jgi:primosomal replication protein N
LLGENHLQITGVVAKPPKLSTSPAGIHHCQFSLDHRSEQVEAGLKRQAYCRIKVVVSGDWSKQLTRDLTEGCNIKVTGFLNRHESHNGLPMLVLHATQIEMIN